MGDFISDLKTFFEILLVNKIVLNHFDNYHVEKIKTTLFKLKKIKSSNEFKNEFPIIVGNNINVDSISFNFCHIIYYCHLVIKNFSKHKPVCQFCKHKPKKSFNICSRIQTFKSQIKILICNFYSIPITLIQRIFSRFKPFVYTVDGTYGSDLIELILNYFRSQDFNQTRRFVGVLYADDSDEIVKNFAVEINYLHQKENISDFLLIFSVKSQTSPQHWCGIFIDFDQQIFYFYNSLNKKTHLDDRLYKLLKQANPELKFKTNSARQQYNNNLCGIFSLYFLTKMNNADPQARKEVFAKHFNHNENLDDFIQDTQKFFVSFFNQPINSSFTNITSK